MTGLNRQNRTFFNVHDDTWTALALWSILGSTGIVGSLNSIVNFLLDGQIVWDTVIVLTVLAIFTFLGTAAALKKMQRREFIFIVILALMWIISFFWNEESRLLMQMYYFKPVLIDGVCGIICIASFKNWEKFQKVSRYFIVSGCLLYFIMVVLKIAGLIDLQYMATAYNSLVFIIGACWLAIHEKKVGFIVLAVVGFLAILVAGNRGGLACIAIYILLEFMFNRKIKVLPKVLFFLAIVLLLFNVDNIMESIEVALNKYDYESRTIGKFIDGTLGDDSGREKYRDAAWEVAKEKPIFGYGMGGSSNPLYEKVRGVTPTGIQHTYSHSLFFDLIMDYGIFFGIIIMIVFIIGLIRATTRSRKSKHVEILFLFFSIVIPKLMFSSTYLSESAFFVLIGLLLNFNFLDYDEATQEVSE